MLIVKNIQWGPMPRTPHGTLGNVVSRGGTRRVCAIINENLSPKRPRGLPSLARPFTLELYLPVRVGQDKVLKFVTEAEALAEAERALNAFLSDCVT